MTTTTPQLNLQPGAVQAGTAQPDAAGQGVQGSFDDLGTPLREVTFVVVDLETTGSGAEADAITEIGAVKVRGGEVEGEFATLVNPERPIPAFITVLTGISDAMVIPAPPIAQVLPAFLEFARGAVLVAHNARFDIGFLRAAAKQTGHPWPGFPLLDTVALARAALGRDEVPNCKLATLARYFHTATTPSHRALDDARATVDVLHGLIERVGAYGVDTFEELAGYSSRVPPEVRKKRSLAEHVRHVPGVYIFRDCYDRPLYIGKSVDLASRVRTYFTASETRTRMAEMVRLAERIDTIECAHILEAEVRELRLLAEHKPRYNRRSRFPERVSWIKLTTDRFPRLSIVRTLTDDGATYLGPFGARRRAEQVVELLGGMSPLRRCSARITARSAPRPCALAEIGSCSSPCDGSISVDQYAVHIDRMRELLVSDPAAVVDEVTARLARLATEQRFEEAAAERDRLGAYLQILLRFQRLSSLAAVPELVAAARSRSGGWEISVIRYGRFVGGCVSPSGARPWPYVDAVRATAENPEPGPGPIPAASAEEMECILGWLRRPEVQIVRVEGRWSSPIPGAGAYKRFLAPPPGVPTDPGAAKPIR